MTPHKDREFLTADGLKMAYRVWGDRPETLLCVHGLTRNGRDFDTLAEHLSERYTVICPDMIGRGHSDWAESAEQYQLGTYVRDILGLLAQVGATEIDYLGTSMGGLIGMALASQPGTPVRRLILNDAPPEVSEEALQGIADYARAFPHTFATLEEAEAKYRATYVGLGRLSEAQWHKFTLDSVHRTADGRWESAYDPKIIDTQDSPPGGLDVWDLYKAIRCPVLELRGAESPIVSPQVADKLRQVPGTTVVEIEGCGHAPPLVSEDQIQIVADFLATETA